MKIKKIKYSKEIRYFKETYGAGEMAAYFKVVGHKIFVWYKGEWGFDVHIKDFVWRENTQLWNHEWLTKEQLFVELL